MNPHVDRLRLLGVHGTAKLLSGELSRVAHRALDDAGVRHFRSLKPQRIGLAGVAYPFDARLAFIATQYVRTAARALWDLYETPQSRLEPLYAELREAVANDTRGVLWSGARISVLAFAPRSVAAGERQVVGAVKNALLDGAAERGLRLTLDPARPDLVFHARSHEAADGTPLLTVSLDLAGRPLHERGYRMQAGEAPLREDLAAALVMLSRFDARSEALFDPMAGSGTIAIEAASMARGRPLWHSGRGPQAQSWPALERAFATRPAPLFGDTNPCVLANELDARTFSALSANLATAGVEPDVTARQGDFRDLDPRHVLRLAHERGFERGVVLCNPPWGERLGRDDPSLARLYRDLGEWTAELPGWRVGVLAADPDFPQAFGARPVVEAPLRSGPLSATFFGFAPL